MWQLHLGESNQKKPLGELSCLRGPFFAVVVHNETRLPLLNVNLSYKSPSSRRILFLSGGYPSQFSCLEKFMDLMVPGWGCRKGIIIQGRHLKCRFYCGRPVMPEKKRECNGSVCPCTPTEEQYVRTDDQTVYLQYQTNRIPSLSNPPIQTTPPGTLFTAALNFYQLAPMAGTDQQQINTKSLLGYTLRFILALGSVLMFLTIINKYKITRCYCFILLSPNQTLSQSPLYCQHIINVFH